MSRRTALQVALPAAEEQWGLITAAQLQRRGIGRWDIDRLAADGVLERIPDAQGVYRLVGAAADPFLVPLAAAWLQLNSVAFAWERVEEPDAVVSHRSAAHLHGLGDVLADVHEFSTRVRRRSRRADVRVVTAPDALDRENWRVVRGLPVSTPLRLLHDLLAAREDGSAVAGVVRDAVRVGSVAVEDVNSLAARHARDYAMPSPEAFAEHLLGERS